MISPKDRLTEYRLIESEYPSIIGVNTNHQWSPITTSVVGEYFVRILLIVYYYIFGIQQYSDRIILVAYHITFSLAFYPTKFYINNYAQKSIFRTSF